MSLNDVVSADRIHISFFGIRNAGKSSVVNKVTNQSLSVVSDVPGTTTDPVKKAMELLPLGPVVIIDTPGFDDEGALGEKRVEKTREILSKTDIAVLVTDSKKGLCETDNELISLFEARSIPYILVLNKVDLIEERRKTGENEIYVSALTGENITSLKELIAGMSKGVTQKRYIISDLIDENDHVILVIPIDESAPKGRLILPQQQTIRELLDHHHFMSICQPAELSSVISNSQKKPKLVITDSQAFGEVSKCVPHDIYLTSFSILFARYKGELETLIEGARKLDDIKDGDHILISEGCTHHRQCNDIGTVKIPSWIEKHTGKKPVFSFTQGGEFPKDLSPYSLIVHCGGCMLNNKEMQYRLKSAEKSGVCIVNYGILIAYMNSILKRSIEIFPLLSSLME